MIAIIKGKYSGRTIEKAYFTDYAAAEDYVFTKYNSVWDINQNDGEAVFTVYQD